MKDPKAFWNNRYGDEAYAYGHSPNLFFKEQLMQLTAGKILLPAEGEGRNAVFAAQQAWEVAAFDWSESGQKKALDWAASNEVNIQYEVAQAEEVVYEPASFDALGLIFANFAAENRKAIHQKLLTYLKPGGYVIFESYSKEQLEYQRKYDSGGPKVGKMLFSEAEIKEEFAGLTFKLLETKEVELQEGAYHSGPASVLHFLGQKR